MQNQIFLKDFIYFFDRQRPQIGREAGRERGGSRLPAEQRVWCGAWSQGPEIMTWAKGRGLIHWAPWHPNVGRILILVYVWRDLDNLVISILSCVCVILGNLLSLNSQTYWREVVHFWEYEMTSFFIPDKICCAFPFSSSFLPGGISFY